MAEDEPPKPTDSGASLPGRPEGEGPRIKVVDRRWWARQPGAEAEAGAGAASLKPSYVEELERQLAEKDNRLQQAITELRETSRDFDGARARLRKEVSKDIERARRTVLVELLDVLDNLDRSIEAAGRAGAEAAGPPQSLASPAALLQGVMMVRDQFLAKLEGFGVRRLAALGQPFDPTTQEAVTLVPSTDPEQDGRVAGIIAHGYAIGDEVLRPARVAVARVTIAPEKGSA